VAAPTSIGSTEKTPTSPHGTVLLDLPNPGLSEAA
jgi:hypothetical protein